MLIIQIVAFLLLITFTIYLSYGVVMMVKEEILDAKIQKRLEENKKYKADLEAASKGSLIPKK